MLVRWLCKKGVHIEVYTVAYFSCSIMHVCPYAELFKWVVFLSKFIENCLKNFSWCELPKRDMLASVYIPKNLCILYQNTLLQGPIYTKVVQSPCLFWQSLIINYLLHAYNTIYIITSKITISWRHWCLKCLWEKENITAIRLYLPLRNMEEKR